MNPKEKSELIFRDFDSLNWHDCTIYSISLINNSYELVFDIDYILKWINPEESKEYYKFKLAPAELKFQHAYNLNLDISSNSILNIDNISRNNHRKNKIQDRFEWDWIIECQEGVIDFSSSEFTLKLKEEPIISNEQSLGR